MKFLTLLLLLSSCTPILRVDREYLTRSTLSSTYTHTPDPYYNCPPQGEKLCISWSLPENATTTSECFLNIQMRYRNSDQIDFTVPITKDCGRYIYSLCNDDYFRTMGILTYKIELFSGGFLFKEWIHPMWMDRLILE